ncbi:MAG: alpha/beta fold hydrolase, partial [Acidimicrobiia bacterium]|nr:alpha/beta fold hydrolase [Acidimicrobiia bacterium]MDX2468158.1 alpha/beta fold hydrolase [Acidimicrobiia bacterium]
MTKPVALATTTWGTGPRRALLLHGLTSAGAIWWRVADELVAMGFTVVAPDLRAHGNSPAGDDLTIGSYRDDVLLLGGGWDLLIGHSLGGAIAAVVSAVHPLFASRLNLEDPALDSVETARLLAESPEPTANPTIAGIAAEHPDWHPRDVEIKVEALLQCGVEAPQRTMEDASPWDVWNEAGSVQVPTLLLAADPTQGS